MARDIKQLHPALQAKIAQLQTLCTQQGLKIGISECLRTVSEQDALYAKGRTAPGSIVTKAQGSSYSSMHQWGVAFDFYRNDGTGAYNDADGFFTKVGKLGQSIGLEWGGAWASIKDKPHLQLPDWGSTPTKLKAQYGTPDKFFATWSKTTAAAPAVDNGLREVTCTGNGVNIRRDPSTSGKVLAQAYKGDGMTWNPSKDVGNWARVNRLGVDGYISKQYIQ